MTPKRNCLKCKLYDACANFDDGRCLLVERKGVEKHESYGLSMTAPQWAEFLGVVVSTVHQAILFDTLDKLFEKCAKREFDKMHKNEEKPRKCGRPSPIYTYKGTSKTAIEWAQILGVMPQAVNKSIKDNVFDKRYKQRLAERGYL